MRLIDADALTQSFWKNDVDDFGLINQAPTIQSFTLADIEEQYRKGFKKGLSEWETARSHGEWIRAGQSFVDPDKFRNFYCTNCFYDLDEHIRIKPNFCPNCGAQMGEVKKNEID